MRSGINVDAATARSIKEKHGVVCEVRSLRKAPPIPTAPLWH